MKNAMEFEANKRLSRRVNQSPLANCALNNPALPSVFLLRRRNGGEYKHLVTLLQPTTAGGSKTKKCVLRKDGIYLFYLLNECRFFGSIRNSNHAGYPRVGISRPELPFPHMTRHQQQPRPEVKTEKTPMAWQSGAAATVTFCRSPARCYLNILQYQYRSNVPIFCFSRQPSEMPR